MKNSERKQLILRSADVAKFSKIKMVKFDPSAFYYMSLSFEKMDSTA